MKTTRPRFTAIFLVTVIDFVPCIHEHAATASEPETQIKTGLPDTKEEDVLRNSKTLFGQSMDPDASKFGIGWFPETLRAPEMDFEYSEMRLDYFHAEGNAEKTDEVKVELEHNFRLLTIEMELPYVWLEEHGNSGESDRENAFSKPQHDRGLSKVEIGIRYPLFRWLSSDKRIDYTCVGAFEVALPSNTSFSKDTEFSPRIYQLLRVGDRLSIQVSTAYGTRVGPDDGGANGVEYAASFGYSAVPQRLSIPGVVNTWAIFELVGENALTGHERGHNPLFGVAGFRVNTEPISFLQPRVGVGYEFPMNDSAREEFTWGVLLSLNFEL